MNQGKLSAIAAFIFIPIMFFIFSPSARAVGSDELMALVVACLKKGSPIAGESAVYLAKLEKIDKTSERRLYFTVRYAIKNKELVIEQIDFVDETWTAKDGKVVVRQKLLIDVATDSQPPGRADFLYERVVEDGFEKSQILTDRKEIEKAYDGYVKEMLAIVAELEIGEDDDGIGEQGIIQPYKPQI